MTQYLIRFDDIYTGMNPQHFEKVCSVLQTSRIPAILGITTAWEETSFADLPPTAAPIPPGSPEPYTTISPDVFWSKLRELQDLKCEMALHGYCHKLHYGSNFFNINPYGEFSGLPELEQISRLKDGIKIMRDKGLAPRVFMPPAHSIDKNTITALKKVGITAITDGKTLYPHYINEVLFIPQITSEIKPYPFGLITICLHPQYMTERCYEQLTQFVHDHRNEIVSTEDVLAKWQREPLWAKAFNRVVFKLYQLRNTLFAKVA